MSHQDRPSAGARPIRAALFLVGAVIAGFADEPPRELRELFDARAKWTRGRQRVETRDHRRGGRALYYEYRFAGDAELASLLGDEAGVVTDYPPPLEELRYSPQHVLISGEARWDYIEGLLMADLADRDIAADATHAVRCYGLTPAEPSRPLAESLWLSPSAGQTPARFSRRSEPNGVVIEAERDGYRQCWYLDERRGGQPVRVVLHRPGQPRLESRSRLRQEGGEWYAAEIEYYAEDFAGGASPYKEVRVLSIELNCPDLPATLTPYDMGMDVGVSVARRDRAMRPLPGVFVFDGETAPEFEAFRERCVRKELRPGSLFRANAARMQRLTELAAAAGIPAATSAPARAPGDRVALEAARSCWRAYTEHFITRYQLDPDQAHQARRFLRSCELVAEETIVRGEARAAGLDARGEGAAAASPRESTAAATVADRLKEVFDTMLKPRLDRIPTRRQRAAMPQADRATTSAPTTRPALDCP